MNYHFYDAAFVALFIVSSLIFFSVSSCITEP